MTAFFNDTPKQITELEANLAAGFDPQFIDYMKQYWVLFLQDAMLGDFIQQLERANTTYNTKNFNWTALRNTIFELEQTSNLFAVLNETNPLVSTYEDALTKMEADPLTGALTKRYRLSKESLRALQLGCLEPYRAFGTRLKSLAVHINKLKDSEQEIADADAELNAAIQKFNESKDIVSLDWSPDQDGYIEGGLNQMLGIKSAARLQGEQKAQAFKNELYNKAARAEKHTLKLRNRHHENVQAVSNMTYECLAAAAAATTESLRRIHLFVLAVYGGLATRLRNDLEAFGICCSGVLFDSGDLILSPSASRSAELIQWVDRTISHFKELEHSQSWSALGEKADAALHIAIADPGLWLYQLPSNGLSSAAAFTRFKVTAVSHIADAHWQNGEYDAAAKLYGHFLATSNLLAFYTAGDPHQRALIRLATIHTMPAHYDTERLFNIVDAKTKQLLEFKQHRMQNKRRGLQGEGLSGNWLRTISMLRSFLGDEGFDCSEPISVGESVNWLPWTIETLPAIEWLALLEQELGDEFAASSFVNWLRNRTSSTGIYRVERLSRWVTQRGLWTRHLVFSCLYATFHAYAVCEFLRLFASGKHPKSVRRVTKNFVAVLSALIETQSSMKRQSKRLASLHFTQSRYLLFMGEYELASRHQQRAIPMLQDGLSPENTKLVQRTARVLDFTYSYDAVVAKAFEAAPGDEHSQDDRNSGLTAVLNHKGVWTGAAVAIIIIVLLSLFIPNFSVTDTSTTNVKTTTSVPKKPQQNRMVGVDTKADACNAPSATESYHYGFAAQKAGNTANAMFHYRSCLETEPGCDACHYELGWSYWVMKDWTQVIQSWEQVLALNPKHPGALKWLPKAKNKIPVTVQTLEEKPITSGSPPGFKETMRGELKVVVLEEMPWDCDIQWRAPSGQFESILNVSHCSSGLSVAQIQHPILANARVYQVSIDTARGGNACEGETYWIVRLAENQAWVSPEIAECETVNVTHVTQDSSGVILTFEGLSDQYRVNLAELKGPSPPSDSIAEAPEFLAANTPEEYKRLGDEHYLPNGPNRDFKRAAYYYRKGCDGNNLLACESLAFMYRDGHGVSRSGRTAKDLYIKACEGGLALSCKAVGRMVRYGRGVPENHHEALKFYDMACGIKHAESCFDVGAIYERGLIGKPDFQKAKTYYLRACDLARSERSINNPGAKGCTNVSAMYARGIGVSVDFAIADKFSEDGCQLGDVGGCTNACVLYEFNRAKNFGMTFCQKGCDGGSKDACDMLSERVLGIRR